MEEQMDQQQQELMKARLKLSDDRDRAFGQNGQMATLARTKSSLAEFAIDDTVYLWFEDGPLVEHNDKSGTVQEYLASADRFLVALDGGGMMSVPSTNLRQSPSTARDWDDRVDVGGYDGGGWSGF